MLCFYLLHRTPSLRVGDLGRNVRCLALTRMENTVKVETNLVGCFKAQLEREKKVPGSPPGGGNLFYNSSN